MLVGGGKMHSTKAEVGEGVGWTIGGAGAAGVCVWVVVVLG
jgi:hypothetical protein